MDARTERIRVARPALVVMSGLPATGKSAIAHAVARARRWPWFAVDSLEATLLRRGISREQHSDIAAYDLALALAETQMRLGQGVVVDAVNGYPPVQEAWRLLGEACRTRVVVIATVCSDEALHRSRLEGRSRDLDGFIYEPTWEDLWSGYAEWYVPFPAPDLVLDAVESLDDNVARALAATA